VGFQKCGFRNLATVMMIRIEDAILVGQQLFERFPVFVKGDIQDGDAAGNGSRQSREECYVAFDPGNQR